MILCFKFCLGTAFRVLELIVALGMKMIGLYGDNADEESIKFIFDSISLFIWGRDILISDRSSLVSPYLGRLISGSLGLAFWWTVLSIFFRHNHVNLHSLNAHFVCWLMIETIVKPSNRTQPINCEYVGDNLVNMLTYGTYMNEWI